MDAIIPPRPGEVPGGGPPEKRRAPRYPVTLSARLRDAGRTVRAEVRDVSAGGLLLSVPGGPSIPVGTVLRVDAAVIGRVVARVVGLSERGLHLEVEPDAHQYAAAIRRLSGLSRSWSEARGALPLAGSAAGASGVEVE